MSEPHDRFTRFALDLHGVDGVSDAAVLLQDRCGVDVDVLLLAAFVSATQRKQFSTADLRTAHQRVERWQKEVVAPLRAIRRRLKTGPPPAPDPATSGLRDRIKQLELDAEMIELGELADLAQGLRGAAATGEPVDIARAAIRVVVQDSAGREPTPDERRAIENIAVAAVQTAGGT